jgi:hypothetical protein
MVDSRVLLVLILKKIVLVENEFPSKFSDVDSYRDDSFNKYRLKY